MFPDGDHSWPAKIKNKNLNKKQKSQFKKSAAEPELARAGTVTNMRIKKSKPQTKPFSIFFFSNVIYEQIRLIQITSIQVQGYKNSFFVSSNLWGLVANVDVVALGLGGRVVSAEISAKGSNPSSPSGNPVGRKRKTYI